MTADTLPRPALFAPAARLAHPFSGLDQVLAMIAVGLWGAALGLSAAGILMLGWLARSAA